MGGFEHHALMHGVGADQPVELFRIGDLGLDAARPKRAFEPPGGILGGKHPRDRPPWIGKRGLDRRARP